MAANLGSAEGRLELNISGFMSNLTQAQSALSAASNNFQNAGSTIKSFGDGLQSAGKKMTTAVTLPIVGIGAASVKLATDFEYQMSKVQAISGVTGDDLLKLSDKAREMGSGTMYSASQAGEALEYMALAGWKTDDMINALEPTLKLAAAAGMDLGRTSDIITDNMTAFGMSADGTSKVLRDGVLVEINNVTRFADVMAATMSNSNTTVDMLGESFKYVAPLAGNLGYSVEDVALALGTMANSGIKSSQAGTSLRRMLINMSKPTDDVATAMKGLGISMFNVDGSARPLRDVLNNLRSSLRDSGGDFEEYQRRVQQLTTLYENGAIKEGEYEEALYRLASQTGVVTDKTKAQALATLAGATGMSGLAAIIGATDEEWNKLANTIDNASGSSERMYEVMTSNLKGALTELSSALQEAGIELGNVMLPVIEQITDKIRELVEKFQGLSEETKTSIVEFALAAAAIGPVILIFGKLTSAIGSIISLIGNIGPAVEFLGSAFSKVGAAIGGISAPVAAVVAIIAVLAAAFATLWNTSEEFRNNLTSTFEGLKEKVSGAMQGIVEAINSLGFDFSSIIDVIKAAWEGFCGMIAPVFEGAWTAIAGVIGGVAQMIQGLVEIVAGIINGDFAQVWQGASNYVEGFVSAIGSILDGAGEIVYGLIQNVANLFGADWSMSWDEAKEAVGNFVSGIGEWLAEVPSKIGEFVSSVVEWFSTLPARFAAIWGGIKAGITAFVSAAGAVISNLPAIIGNVIGSIIGTVASFVVNMAQKAVELGSQFVNNAVNFFSQLPGRISNFLTSTITNVSNWVSNMIQNAVRAGTQFLNSVVNGIKNLPSNIANILTTIISKVTSWASNMVSKGKQGATETANAVVNGLKELPSKVMEIGKSIVEGLWNGISGAAGWLKDQLSSFASGVVEGFKSSFKVNSPSRLLRDEVGRWLPPGIAEGVKVAMPKAVKDIQNTIDKEMDKLDVDTNLETNINGFGNTITSVFNMVANWFEDIEDRLSKSVSNMSEQLRTLIDYGQLIVSPDGTLSLSNGLTLGGPTRPSEGQMGADNKSVVNNFTFYTDEPIDEIEAARLLKKTQQDIAEGFIV